MENQTNPDLVKKEISPWVVTIITLLITVLIIGALAWQYRQMVEKAEKAGQEILTLKEIIEEQLAEDLLEKFMEARIAKNKDQALAYFTERAMEQYSQGEFTLMDNFKSFEIFKTEKLEKTKFRFIIKVQEGEMNSLVEVIIVTKILDRYYIDSVEIAG